MRLPLLFAALALTGAAQTSEPIQARVILVHRGETYRINCPALTDCSIEAPKGEKFVRFSVGMGQQLFPTSDLAEPSRFFSIKASFQGQTTSFHLETDHDNQYGFLMEQHAKLPIDYTIILESADTEITHRIAAPSTVVPRADYEAEHRANEELRKTLEAVKQQETQHVDAARSETQKADAAKHQEYSFNRDEAAKAPWVITGMFTDGDRMWIRRDPKAPDLPSVTATDPNGKAEVIVPRYDPDHGLYVVPQLITSGYLSFGGKKKLAFSLAQTKS